MQSLFLLSLYRVPEVAAGNVAWLNTQPPNKVWPTQARPNDKGMMSNRGGMAVTNWDVPDTAATFGGTPPVWTLPNCPLAHNVVVWTPPEAVGGVVVSIVLTRREAQQLMSTCPRL